MVQASPLRLRTAVPLGRRLARLLGPRLFGWPAPDMPVLDPAELTDEFKRDLGFADGHALRPRDPERD